MNSVFKSMIYVLQIAALTLHQDIVLTGSLCGKTYEMALKKNIGISATLAAITRNTLISAAVAAGFAAHIHWNNLLLFTNELISHL